jgi:glyoxylate/hydroxypyruvate reductase
MTLLIDVRAEGWMTDQQLKDLLRQHLPDADIRTRGELGQADDVTMLAVSSLAPDLPGQLPNLQLVQKLGAGVETIVSHPSLPDHVRVTRLKPDLPAREIAEYCLAHVLNGQRHLSEYARDQARGVWQPKEPRVTTETRVGVLGLGHIGGMTARLMRDFGFETHGWSRSPKDIEGVICHHGASALLALLAQCDYVCAILPSTEGTRSLINADTLQVFKPGARLVNAGRGDLIDEPALMAALDTGPLGHAVLDVVSQEPLPSDNPLWLHPGVTITPHVSGWHLGDALKDIAENYRRLCDGAALLHEVDRLRGY